MYNETQLRFSLNYKISESGPSTNPSSTRSSLGNTVITIADDSVFSTDGNPPCHFLDPKSKRTNSNRSFKSTSSTGSIKIDDSRRDIEFEIQISRNKTIVRETTTLVFENCEEHTGDSVR